ncbi:MAG: GNAT family N-acetyltransferase [Ethanoligenens sp.]
MQIRLMQIADYQDLFDIWSKTEGMGLRTLDDSQKGIQLFLKRNPNTCFVAQQDGQLIGGILCGNDGRRGYIYHTAVLPSCRRQGTGKQLVNAVLKALEHENIYKVALVVYENNVIGNSFWESIRFAVRKDLIYRNKSIREQ